MSESAPPLVSPIERVLLRPSEAAVAMGISRSVLYELIRSGELRSISLGRSRLIPMRAIDEWVAARLETDVAEREAA